jgi:hypothetical protein
MPSCISQIELLTLFISRLSDTSNSSISRRVCYFQEICAPNSCTPCLVRETKHFPQGLTVKKFTSSMGEMQPEQELAHHVDVQALSGADMPILPITLVAMLVAFAMSVAIGAQDVSNALGTSVGSKAITVRQAVYIGAVCEFLGSLAGGGVAHTISHGIFDSSSVTAATFRAVMASTMAGAVVWLFAATWLGLPVSTTHSLIGSLVGIAVAFHGSASVKWATITKTGMQRL